MTDEEAAAIKARADAAARGPWTMTGETELTGAVVWADDGDRVAIVDGGQAHATDPAHMVAADDNAAFIAHAREDIPTLLAEVKRLRNLVIALRENRQRLLEIVRAVAKSHAYITQNRSSDFMSVLVPQHGVSVDDLIEQARALTID